MKSCNLLRWAAVMAPAFLVGGPALIAQTPAPAAPAATGGVDWLMAALLIVAVMLFALIAILGYVLGLLAQGLQRKLETESLAGKTGGAVIVLLLCFFAQSLQAVTPVSMAPEPVTPGDISGTTGLYLLLGVTILLEIGIIAVLFRYVRVFSRKLVPPAAVAPKPGLLASIDWKEKWAYVMGLNPMANEKDLLTDHEYDGIVELDNRMPPWLAFLFLATIGFAVVYLTYFHVLGAGAMQLDEYAEEVKQGEAQKLAYFAKFAESIDEKTVTLVTDEHLLAEGKSIFIQNCATCHGQQGQGLAGPNLTDDYWKHGGSINQLFKVVRYGVQGTAMKTWGDEMLPSQIQKVCSYIKTLRGTNPPNALGPDGALYVEEGAQPAPDASGKAQ